MFTSGSGGRGDAVPEPECDEFAAYEAWRDAGPFDDLVEGPPTPGTTRPSGSMVWELDHATASPALLSPAELVDAVVGFERAVAWATARQQELIAEFNRRPENGALAPNTGPEARREWAGEEIGLALTLAPSRGAACVAAADRLAGVLRPTRDLLEAGRISPDRARLVTDTLGPYDDTIAAAVQHRVLPRAPEQTWGQLRSALTRAIEAEVPDPALRHRRARRERRVELYPGADGMATLSAWLTAAEATASFEWITRLARGSQPAGPDGTETGRGRGSMDRRRADVLVALLTGRLIAAAGAGAVVTGSDLAPADAVPTDAVPMDAATMDAATADAVPAGAVHQDTAQADTAQADPAQADTEPTDADVASADVAPACEAQRAGAQTAGAQTVGAQTVGARRAGVLAAPVSAHRPLIHITIPISTLLGYDDEPAHLAGYGPMPASAARDIALDPDSTWRRLLTDPITGQVLDHGRSTYRPPAPLAGFVRTRDGTCRYPGCRRPAVACELDHVQPWAGGGATSEDNLCTLCERHHDLKEQLGWQVVLHKDRTLEWLTPTGHRYRSHPVEHLVPTGTDPAPNPSAPGEAPDASVPDQSRRHPARPDESGPAPAGRAPGRPDLPAQEPARPGAAPPGRPHPAVVAGPRSLSDPFTLGKAWVPADPDDPPPF